MKPHLKRKLQAQYNGFLQTPTLFSGLYDDMEFFQIDREFPDHLNLSEGFEIPENIRLGQRMEYYFQEAVDENRRFRMIAKNLQIIHQKETLGEIDFLLWDTAKLQVLHIELAYKFYLFIPDQNRHWTENWQGVNLRDNLHKKLDKFRQQQLPLLYKKEALPQLLELDIQPREVIQKVCLKGQLFLPLKAKLTTPRINASAVMGNWFPLEKLEMVGAGKAEIFIPPKNDWVSIPDNDLAEWLTPSEAKELLFYLKKNQQSTLIWLRFPGGELQRHFVVWWD
ncbi:MAG: DUF1853 family protein [Leeuwenhoekiella sp.]